MFGPRIDGERSSLVPPTGDDDYLALWVRWFADPLVTKWLEAGDPQTMESEDAFFRRVATSRTDVFWSIQVGGRPIGNIGIHGIDWRSRSGRTGIVIGERDYWHKGYATEAMRLRTRYAFEQLGLETLTATVSSPNEASRKALERAGYREAGRLRRHFFRDGVFHDVWIGEVLRSEWAVALST